MPKPFFDPRRRELEGSAAAPIQDELTQLSAMGVGALICLLDNPIDGDIYRGAGFELLYLPVANGSPPTRDQWLEFCRFVDQQTGHGRAVVVFCEAGLGRTGTLLAAYLVYQGHGADAAIARVRGVEPAAIETPRQIAFLHEIEGLLPRGGAASGSWPDLLPPTPLSGAA